MKDEDIINVLMQNYKYTVILSCFEDKIFFSKQNLGSIRNSGRVSDDHVLKAECIINQGNLRYCSWDKNDRIEKKQENDYNGDDNEENEYSDEEEEAVLEGDILIDNFMSEIHRIYKKAEKDIDANDILILQAFSLALASAVAQGMAKKDYDDQRTGLSPRKRYIHYIFILPTEWEHGVKNKIIVPIFKQAGLVDEKDQPCKLLFYTELDTILERLNDEQNLELESGREYILWELDPINRKTLTMAYDCFESRESKASNRSREESKQYRGTTIRNPVRVYSSNKVYSLTYIDTIRQSVRTFLETEGIIEIFPPACMNKEKEENIMTLIDMVLEAALMYYSEELENKKDLSKLSIVYPFRHLNLTHCKSILKFRGISLLKSVQLFKMHGIMFRDNEAIIEEVLNDIVTINDSSRSNNKRRRIFFANNGCRESFTRVIESPAKFDETSTSYWAKKLGINAKMLTITDEIQIETKLSEIYIHWIYCFILKFENDPKYETLFASTNLPYRCVYDTSDMTHYAALKFKNSAAFLITRLPPLLLNLPCSSKKDGALQDSQFTKKSNPEYIVKIDVKLFGLSTFSCVQFDDHGKKGSVKTILINESCEDNNYMSLPALSNYFKPNSIDGYFYPERIYITTRLLEIISTHFRDDLDYFSKYDRQKSKNERLFTVEEEQLDSKDKPTLNEHSDCLLSSFDSLIPEIKLELEKSGGEEISQQCYIRVFLMIYLGVLKYNISTFLKEKIGKKHDAADENTIIGYTILVDAFFFHTYLKESHDSLIELAIASGFAKDGEDCKANVRVITEREEQLLPILEQKLGTNLPLKSFYVHGRLYERYLHFTLNQVVIEGLLPNYQNSKNIVIKSKVIAIPYLLDMICDNLWDAAQNCNCIILDFYCERHNEKHASLQEFSLVELKVFKAKFLHCAEKLFFTDSISKYVGISMPISNACGCKLYFGRKDIFDLGIIPAIKYTVSVFTGAITNEDIFGLYGIEHFFVAFDYFTSVFHRSYQKYFEYNLKRLIDINLEKKRLKIPYTVFPEPIGGLLQPVTNENCILIDCFLHGNILQVFGETYSLSARERKMCSKVFGAGGYRMLEEKQNIAIVEKGEIIPRTGVIKKVLYFGEFIDVSRFNRETSINITKRGSNNHTDNASEQQESLLEEYFADLWAISSGKILSSEKNSFDKQSYIPLYITVKNLNYSSSVMLSPEVKTGFTRNFRLTDEDTYSILTERLTIINTQSE